MEESHNSKDITVRQLIGTLFRTLFPVGFLITGFLFSKQVFDASERSRSVKQLMVGQFALNLLLTATLILLIVSAALHARVVSYVAGGLLAPLVFCGVLLAIKSVKEANNLTFRTSSELPQLEMETPFNKRKQMAKLLAQKNKAFCDDSHLSQKHVAIPTNVSASPLIDEITDEHDTYQNANGLFQKDQDQSAPLPGLKDSSVDETAVVIEENTPTPA